MRRFSVSIVIALATAAALAAPAGATFRGHNGRIAWAVYNAGGGGGGGYASLTTFGTRGGRGHQLGYCGEDSSGNVCQSWENVASSPSGSQLVWNQPDASGRLVLTLAAADATGATTIDHDATDDSQPSFSPDGSHIVFVTQPTGAGGVDGTLVIGDLMGVSETTVSSTIQGSAPEFTPNGHRILFLRSGGAIWSIGTGGETPRRLVRDAAAFDVSPSGRSIAYLTSRGALWVARADGTHPRRLAREPVSDLPSPAVRFSPDGKLIVFSAFGHRQQSGAALYLIKATGGRPHLLSDSMDPRTVTSGLAWQAG